MTEGSSPDRSRNQAILEEVERACPEMLNGLVTDIPLPQISPDQMLAALRTLPDGAGVMAAIREFYRQVGLPFPSPREAQPRA
jgi:hypothetical protein